MKKLNRIPVLILLAAALLFAGGRKLYAQAEVHMGNAYSLVYAGKTDSAKIEIDLCFQDTTFAKDPMALYVKGFVYNEYYKKYESKNVNSPARVIALQALEKSYTASTDTALSHVILIKIRYIAGQFYNDAVLTLDT